MKTFNELGIQIPEILLPSNNNIEKWAVVACDQYTQDKEYWKNVEEITKDKFYTIKRWFELFSILVFSFSKRVVISSPLIITFIIQFYH